MVTGGAGYIGSHTCVELLENGYDIAVLDNLDNSCEEALERVKKITGKDFPFYKVDLLDYEATDKVFAENKFDAVIHFAGLKAVGESVAQPLRYYHNNITGTLNLLDIMNKYNVKKMVFSSSATVYGDPHTVPIKEDFPLSCTNPYGQTKLTIEYILKDLCKSDPDWGVILLRYFNPECLSVFGDDYDTKDGTGVRDYIHVTDLAVGHLNALEKIKDEKGVLIYNLGTGVVYSVLDMVKAFSKACGKDIKYKIVGRRPGDIAACYADPSKANKELGFKAVHTLDEMCADTWNWQTKNPNGYKG